MSTTGRRRRRWEPLFRVLEAISYTGSTSVEWEDASIDRRAGGTQMLAFVRALAATGPSMPAATGARREAHC